MVLEPLGDRLGVLHVTLDAQAERLDALDERERAVGRERRTGVAQQRDAGLDDVGDARRRAPSCSWRRGTTGRAR